MIAQERIWAWEKPGGLGSVRGWTDKQCDATEYTRTDLIPAMIAESVAKERERCAQIAEHRVNRWLEIEPPYDGSLEEAIESVSGIAAAIRSVDMP